MMRKQPSWMLVWGLVLAVALPLSAPWAQRNEAGQEQYEIKEVIAGAENYEYIKSLMIMMNENRSLDEINKVVYEVERYVLIADDLLEVAKIFYQPGPELAQMRRVAAKSHLLLVAFYLYQKNFSQAIEHFRMAEEIYPEIYDDPNLEIEVKAERDRELRNVVRYEMYDIPKFKSWYEGYVGGSFQFEVEVASEFTPANLKEIAIKSLQVVSPESASYRLIELANLQIAKNLEEGKRFFRITLAPGDYQITQAEGTIFPQKFSIREVDQQPFTVFIQPDNWFAMLYADNYERKSPPRLYYYGVLMDSAWFDHMPYGEYEIRLDPKFYDFEFAKIYFRLLEEGEDGEISAGADYIEIPVAEGSKYILDLGKKGIFSRLSDRTVD
jgi:hypothetical protein